MPRFVPTSRAAGHVLLLAALLSALGLWAPAQVRGPVVSTAPALRSPTPVASPAYLFLSSNTDEGVSAEEAWRRARSPDHAHFKLLAEDILRQVGVHRPRVFNAVGDWSDGAENSLLAVIVDPPGPGTLRYAASWFGLLAQQKTVLAFWPNLGGLDAVVLLDVPQLNLAEVRRWLDTHGVRQRTLVPHSGGHRVIIYDQGRRLQHALAVLAKRDQVRYSMTIGHGEELGERTRGKARDHYRAIIDAYEGKAGRRHFRPLHLPPLVRLAPSR